MCGIIIKNNFDDTIESIKHRGIEFNYKEFEGKFFCHYRLPIQTIFGDKFKQPIIIKRRYLLLYVGEIFNYNKEKYNSDVEYLIDFFGEHNSYASIHINGLKEINSWDGFWSIVLYDIKKKNITVFTDPLGKKQLYYRTDTKEICSEIKGLVDSKWDTKEIDDKYFSIVNKFGYNTDDSTCYKKIKRFLPNNIYYYDFNSKYSDNWAYVSNYYDFKSTYLSVKDFKNIMEKAVVDRLISKKYTISVLISGGLDSSIIAYYLKKNKAKVNYFTIDNETDNEYVDILCNHLKIKVKKLNYSMGEIDNKYFNIMEGPVDLGSVIPQYHLFQAVKNDTDDVIVITGDGADELFGGYKRMSDYDSQLSDTFQELPFYHLIRLDRMSMYFTLENRCPFLSHDVVRFALLQKYHDRIGKKTLKDIFKADLPNKIIYREKEPLKNPLIRQSKEKYRYRIVKMFYKNLEKRLSG